ncbi:MAG: sugar ABC transporter permease [Anaerolineae bacterium]|nr:sugar ABC transporter permease [Anaerolineae bacterium]
MTTILKDPRKYAPYIFLLPAVLVLAIGLLVPLWNAFYLSFFDWKMGTPWDTKEFIGLDSYVRMIYDDDVYQSLWVTLKFSFWVMLLEMVLGISLALLLEKPIKGAAIFRTIFILPLMVSPVAVGLIWRYLYDARSGIINYYLERIGEAVPLLQYVGFERQLWLADPNLALTSIIITDIWQWTPFIIIIILAGLQALPSDTTAAAYIDGANWWQMILYVKLPMIRSIILVTFLMRLIDVFRALEVMYILTFGGPGLSTQVLALHIYKTAFTAQQLGYASTISMLLIVILLILSVGVMIYQNPLKEGAE